MCTKVCIWKQWKTPQNRIKNLMKLGVDKDTAWITAYTDSRIAYVCQRRVMNFAINKERLTQFELPSILRSCQWQVALVIFDSFGDLVEFWLFVKSGGKKIFDTVVNHCSQLCFLFLSRGYQDSIPKVLEISISISISFNYFNLIVCSFRKPI